MIVVRCTCGWSTTTDSRDGALTEFLGHAELAHMSMDITADGREVES